MFTREEFENLINNKKIEIEELKQIDSERGSGRFGSSKK